MSGRNDRRVYSRLKPRKIRTDSECGANVNCAAFMGLSVNCANVNFRTEKLGKVSSFAAWSYNGIMMLVLKFFVCSENSAL